VSPTQSKKISDIVMINQHHKHYGFNLRFNHLYLK